MAVIVNRNDVLLQATSPRIVATALPSTTTVDWSVLTDTSATQPENNATLGAIGVYPDLTPLQSLSSSIELVKNTLAGGGANAGEIRILPGNLRLADGTIRNVPSNRDIFTAFEASGTPPDGLFYVVWGATDAKLRFTTQTSWSSGSAIAGWFVATHDRSTNTWFAHGNHLVGEAFTVLETDIFMAICYKSSADIEIRTLNYLVPLVADVTADTTLTNIAANVVANAITATQIATGTITATQIATGTITATQLAANSVTASEILANSVTSSEIAGNTITAANISTGTITVNEMGANSITATQIQANSVGVSEINVTTLSAITANLGTVNAGSITGSANINITGSAKFEGANFFEGQNFAVAANTSKVQWGGVVSYGSGAGIAINGLSSGVSGAGVIGTATGANSLGVGGSSSSASGIGGRFTNGGGGFGLQAGKTVITGQLQLTGGLTTNSSAKVLNLNAELLDSKFSTDFVDSSGNNTFIGVTSSGVSTATFTSTNKPGGSSSNAWLSIIINGVQLWIPAWT